MPRHDDEFDDDRPRRRPVKRTASELYWRAAITYAGNEIVSPD